jgi:hypothetical protein
MPNQDVRMLAELDHLELGPDAVGAWDDLWLDGNGDLVVDWPGWWWSSSPSPSTSPSPARSSAPSANC